MLHLLISLKQIHQLKHVLHHVQIHLCCMLRLIFVLLHALAVSMVKIKQIISAFLHALSENLRIHFLKSVKQVALTDITLILYFIYVIHHVQHYLQIIRQILVSQHVIVLKIYLVID